MQVYMDPFIRKRDIKSQLAFVCRHELEKIIEERGRSGLQLLHCYPHNPNPDKQQTMDGCMSHLTTTFTFTIICKKKGSK